MTIRKTKLIFNIKIELMMFKQNFMDTICILFDNMYIDGVF